MNFVNFVPGLTSTVSIKGYSFNYTNYVFLSSSNLSQYYTVTAINAFANTRYSSLFPPFSGVLWSNYSISNDNVLNVYVYDLPKTGYYDLIILNNAGYIKLSNKDTLIKYQLTPTPTPTITNTCSPTQTPTPTTTSTPTPTLTPSLTQTSTTTPTSTQTPTFTPTNTPTLSLTPSITPSSTCTPTSTLTPTNSQTPTITMTPTRVASPEYISVDSDMDYFSEPTAGQYYPSEDSPDSVWTQYSSLPSDTLGFIIRKLSNPFNPNQSRWEVSYRESELDYVNYGYKDADAPQFFPVGGQYIAMRPGYLYVDLPAPTPTPTPTITPTPTKTPLGIPISNDYVAVNYGNVSVDFGTNVVVERDNGYDPDIVYRRGYVNNSPNRNAFLDANFNIPGYWSFILENEIFGSSYAWSNSSTNFDCIPFSGWYGTSAIGGFLAGTTNLVLSATSQPATPTPTLTPTITPTPSITPFLYDRASKASIQDSYNLLKNISNPAKNYTNFSLLCTLGFNNFCNDWSKARREWNPNFWGYAHRNILNFSGVSLNTELNATLITPQHFIGNSHFAPSLSCCFYDHNTGEAVHIKIQDYRNSGIGEDCYVGKLASPVPAASAIKIYKIAAATTNIPIRSNQFPLFYMGGKAFLTNDDCFHGGCVGSTKTNPFGTDLPRSYINTYSTSLTTVSAAFAGKDFASNGVVGGESSNPMFILLNNDLLLYGTFYYPDNGPWWGSQSILTNVSAAIIEMGSEGYSLSAVYLDQYIPPTATPTPTPTPTINIVESIGGDTLITLEGDIITSI